MFRIVLPVLALPFLLLGAEGLFDAIRARHEATLSCEQYASGQRPSLLVRLTGCEIDYAGAAYRESGGQIQELFFPAHPAGQRGPAPLVAVTSSPAALQIARAALGNRRRPPADELTAAMEKAAAAAGTSQEISGLIRSGVLEGLGSQRVLSGISVPLAEDVAVLDVEARPEVLVPVIQIAAGIILLGTGFLMGREGTPVVAEPDGSDRAEILARLHKHTEALRMAEDQAPTDSTAAPPPPAAGEDRVVANPHRPSRVPARGRSGRERLPAIMLLNVDETAGAADIESAPPLGPKADVIARLRKVLPDLDVDASGRWRRAGPDYSLQLDLGADEIVHTVVIEAAGDEGASAVRSLIESIGWRAFAPKSGQFLDAATLNDVSDNTVILR